MDNRVEGLRKISSYEEYEETKRRLQDYLKQYKWVTETDSPYEDIINAVNNCMNAEERDDAKLFSLKLQYEAIKGDTYIGNLRRNITALYVTVGEYEARLEAQGKREERVARFSKAMSRNKDKENLDKVLQDVKNDAESINTEFVKTETAKSSEKDRSKLTSSKSMRRFRFWLSNLTGMVPGEINMAVENRKEIPLYIIENYDLVNKPEIDPDYKETALTVVPDIDTSFGIFHRLVEVPVNEFIAVHGITEKGVAKINDSHSNNKENAKSKEQEKLEEIQKTTEKQPQEQSKKHAHEKSGRNGFDIE